MNEEIEVEQEGGVAELPEPIGRATYSPEDNKLRLYPDARLDAETYEVFKKAGFKWAPKQELFVAPMWTPGRFDLLERMCGEVEDEDTTLLDRAEAKHERLENLAERTEKAADDTRNSIRAIADNIPFGQPILVGHHSERRARKDAEKIQRGMDKAVKLWESSKYWADRADGALRHAKYKELPAVRARRIKKLEAERRGYQRTKDELLFLIGAWAKVDNMHDALNLANYKDRGGVVLASGEQYWSAWSALTDEKITMEEVKRQRAVGFPKGVARQQRWIDHLTLRIDYERAMLGEQTENMVTKVVAGEVMPEIGGAVRCWKSPGFGRGWSLVTKRNKVSVSILMNVSHYQGRSVVPTTIHLTEIKGVMTKAEVEQARTEGRIVGESEEGFFLADGDARTDREVRMDEQREVEPVEKPSDPSKDEQFRELKKAAKAGVQVVSAPSLFPTPPEVAKRMVELADIEPGMCVLEPSAGTGNLIQAVRDAVDTEVLAYEINNALCGKIRQRFQSFECVVNQGDFLEVEQKFKYPRILMNPPFENGSDIKHIKRALEWLEEGGRLVGVCANGPRQQAQVMPLCDSWEELPAGTFEGTMVRAALFTINA